MGSWIDEGMTVEVRVSTAGDFVKLGKSTVYPFVTGSGGIPSGWTQFVSSNAGPSGVPGDVSWDTTYGRFSVGNLGTDVHGAKTYGIYRDFTINPNKRWLIQVQCRTTANRSTCLRYVKWTTPATNSYAYYSQVWSYEDWEQVSLYSGARIETTMRVWLYAAPYNAADVAPHAPADANWGIQFQNLTLVEMEASYPDPTWETISCDVHSLNVHFGRDKFLERYNVATAQLELLNDDGQFSYGLAQTLRPGRFISIRTMRPGGAGGGYYSFYYGIIDSIKNGFTLDGRSVVSFACIDVSTLLSNTDVPTYSDQYETMLSGYRFRNLALAAGWHPQYLNYDLGQWNQQAILANGRSVRDELGLIADSEGGYFFASKTGSLWYRDRTWNEKLTSNYTVQAELLATPTATKLPAIDTFPTAANAAIIPLHSLDTEWSRDRIVNRVQIANQGGTAIVTEDFDSQTKYGPRSYQRLDLLNDNAHPDYLLARTADIHDGYSEAILRVNNVSFTPQPDAYHFSMLSFLNWLVRVRYEHPTEGWGFVVVTHVQGITHTLSTGSWTVTLSLDEPENFAHYQNSPNGWDAGLWDTVKWDQTP